MFDWFRPLLELVVSTALGTVIYFLAKLKKQVDHIDPDKPDK